MVQIEAPASASALGQTVRLWLAQHPEWWMLALSASAWVLTALVATHDLLPFCTAAAGPVANYFAHLNAAHDSAQLAWDYVAWIVMTLSMMPALIILSVRHVAFRSYSQRRHRAILAFVAGYLGMWAVVGAVVPFLLVGIRSVEMWQSRSAIVAALILAAIWQLSALKRRALLQCHRTTSLSPIGLAADAACLRFGFMQGRACVASCWALMLIPMLASHSIIMMLCVQATLIGERYERRPRIRTAAVFPLLAGALAMVVI